MYLDSDNVPFYIGKGKGDRYLISKHVRKTHPHLFAKLRKVGVDSVQIRFLHQSLVETDALQYETYWIRYIGRKDLGEGTLCNLTDGGESVQFTEETRRKIGRANKGRMPWIKGEHHSAETRKKIGQRPYVFSIVARERMSLAHRKFNDIQAKEIIYMYINNYATLQEIADILKCGRTAIKSCLLRHSIQLRKKGPRCVKE